LICAVSKEHSKGGHKGYWFVFHPHQKVVLENKQTAYIAFGCGSDELILFIPAQDFIQWMDGFNITKKEDRFYWHIIIEQSESGYFLNRKSGFESIDLTKYILS
jgi:hypothetical protein